MADKSFEQQVREELSALRMKPDVAVWVAVETALYKEKKRRWLIWLFLFGACAGAAFLTYYPFNQNKEQQQVIKTDNPSNTITKGQIKEEEKTSIAADVKTQNPAPITVTQNNRVTEVKNTPKKMAGATDQKKGSNQPVKTIALAPEQESDRTVADQNKKTLNVLPANQTDEQTKTREKTMATQNTVAGNGSDENKTSDQRKTMADQAAVVIVNDSASSLQQTEEKITQPVTASPATSPGEQAITIKKNQKKRKWLWAITAEAGSGGVRNPLLKQPLEYNSNPSSPITGTPGSPGAVANVAPVIKDAFSYGIHVQASRQISKKHSVAVSAGYSLFQTTINAGKRVDTSYFSQSGFTANNAIANSGIYSSYYYTIAEGGVYTNRYHFLQLGVDLNTPFRLFKKLSMQWKIGAGINILASTNGLQYDDRGNKFYNNNSLFAKTQSYISTGMDVGIGKNPFLYIGPHWQYSFTSLSSQQATPQHLVLSAVKVSVVLPKKKK